MSVSRREFVLGMAAAGMTASLPSFAADSSCPFRLSVINDELTQDFDRACQIASQDFGLSWIELRAMWNKNVTELDANQIVEAQKILAKYKLRVTDIASPLFKVDWPGAPLSKHSPSRDQFHADFDFKQQDTLLDHCIELAKSFNTDRVRCFDFWRLDDPKPYRAAMNAKLREAADKCAKSGVILLLENEMACNTGTGEEAVEVLKAIPNKNFMLNWDPGNAGTFPGNVPYPDAYNKLPKDRIGHCHCKDVKRQADGKFEWEPVGGGIIDWVGQFKALKRDGYHYAVSLETHWRGAGTPEASTRISMQGLKDSLKKAGISC
ncbi:sugar phosphate isomerase/epimerase [Acidobacterium sp. S8]|uniref:sugar phosphate isomerase/epimerase family protein n=1 Tax=Acidobacterium sp. S8 TaxID=1641854 RepID=UPI00131A6B5D|nr:sugar phosphate isomerase/epimerase family protein [Acidobacterium sp. S8]